ncbi:MAG TPA: DUF4255 domain-containing protein [Puia sp.]|jgi:hypothetical protein|nr:DUF4255 domain-containing protein [Puia sp.]HEV3412111.1 DUF4255 domain-containing protein [Puia sp.]
MIDKVLEFIKTQINSYLQVKLDDHSNTAFIELENIAWNDAALTSSSGNNNTQSNAFMTLVNIEEDRLSESQKNYKRNGATFVNENPKVHLNLYILFAVNLPRYGESLKRLSLIIQFFQYRNVFTPLNSPQLPPEVERLICDMVTLSFQDLNNLWGILGSKYLPSVMFKVRLIKISEEFQEGTAPIVQEIMVTDKSAAS